jgi:SAM-dependent methyltransferase
MPPAPTSPTGSEPPRLFDRALHRKRLDRAARNFGEADFLQRRAAQDVAERLEAIMRDFPLAVDLSARTGAFREALAQSEAAGRIGTLVEADLSHRMLGGRGGARVVLDEERLPFAAQSLDLVVSTLGLHWTNDVVGALVQARLALKPDGLFIGAFLGGQTLSELRQALVAAEAEILGGAGSRVSPFADSSDAAGLLQRAGFALPVADVDRVRVTYDHPLKLLYDLRQMGETSVLAERHPKKLTRAIMGRAFEIYVQRFAGDDGRVPATFEIITLTGWAPHESQPQPLKPGSAKMRLADALGTVEHKVPGTR